MIPLAVFFAVSLVPATAAPPAGKAEAGPIALERKMWGTWHGGACAGDLSLKPNGKFERQHYGPANHTLSGTWAVRWDALPPTLVLICTDAQWAGEIVQLDDAVLAYLHAGSEEPTRYERVKLKK
jgi:hypothetical protein